MSFEVAIGCSLVVKRQWKTAQSNEGKFHWTTPNLDIRLYADNKNDEILNSYDK